MSPVNHAYMNSKSCVVFSHWTWAGLWFACSNRIWWKWGCVSFWPEASRSLAAFSCYSESSSKEAWISLFENERSYGKRGPVAERLPREIQPDPSHYSRISQGSWLVDESSWILQLLSSCKLAADVWAQLIPYGADISIPTVPSPYCRIVSKYMVVLF